MLTRRINFIIFSKEKERRKERDTKERKKERKKSEENYSTRNGEASAGKKRTEEKRVWRIDWKILT